MNSLEQLSAYLRRLEKRFQLVAAARGFAAAAAVALLATVLVVLLSNQFAFSDASLTAGRLLLFLSVALAAGFGLVIPLLKVNRRKAARAAERKCPEFQERLLTLAEIAGRGSTDPFLELLAADTVKVTAGAEPRRIVSPGLVAGFVSGALAALVTLAWLITAGPGFLGYGASMLWAGPSREGMQAFYGIVLEPGNRTVRRGSSQPVTARVTGLQPQTVRLFARYRSTSKWEEAPMLPQDAPGVFGFLFAGIPESLEYYATAGAVRSKTHTLEVMDLPSVKRIRVTYRFPGWTGLKESTEDPGGDLRAVEGTEAEVAVQTDRPLSNGLLVTDAGGEISLDGGGDWRSGRLKIAKDGSYYVAVRAQGELVRLSEDYFIEAKKDGEPSVRIVRPGRDAKVSPIEEVSVAVHAEDDFGLRELNLHYSVNGGPEKTIPLSPQRGSRAADGVAMLPLEDFKLVPGDVVAMHASARDARASANTDIFFLEAQPFEREYSQSQVMGGGGGEGEGGGRISQRQKEIIAATWNQLRNTRDRRAAAENGKFLSEMQSKLREQARSLANRMRRRQLAAANQEFQSFSSEMEKAAEAMGPAAEKLRAIDWKEALPHEQKALQHIMRAESTFRQIQMAFGASQGGGGGMGRDLENLFDLELDTEKNQYETGQQAASAEQRSQEAEEALQRLEQLARRQQELAEQQRRHPQAFQQRWQQEMLRREAEELQRKMEQLTRGQSSQQTSQGQQQQSSGAQGSQSGSPRRGTESMKRGGQTDPRLEQALQRLREATEDMRRSGSPASGQQPSGAESRRAAERLREAGELMRGMRQEENSQQLGDVARRAEELADKQRDFVKRLDQLYTGLPPAKPGRGGLDPKSKEAQQMAGEKLGMAGEIERLERGMKGAARDLAQTNPKAAAKLRDALGNIQKNELALRMRYNHEMLRRGWGQQSLLREGPITQGLESLRQQLREAQEAMEAGGDGKGQGLESALAEVERLRERMERMSRSQRGGQQSGQQGGRQEGAAQGSGQQPGQSQGGEGQGSGQRAESARGGQTGGSQEGGAQRSGGPVFSAMNRGDVRPPEGGADPRSGGAGDMTRFHREAMRGLSELRPSIQEDPEARRALESLIREMQKLDPARFPGNAAMLEQMYAQALPALQQLEVQLRRRLDEKQSGQVRSGAPEAPPPGYVDAVAEYFRRLSQGK